MKNSKLIVNAESAGESKYVFQLFIVDNQPNSARAIINIKRICNEHLRGKYELIIIDLFQKPTLAVSEDIIAVPTLIKKFPLPEIRLFGDLSDTKSVLQGLSFL